MKQPATADQSTHLSQDETVQDLIAWLRAVNLTVLYNSIAHELRGPLNAMSMNLEMLKYVVGDPVKNETDKPEYYIRVLGESIRQLDQRLLLFFGYFASTAYHPLPIQKLLAEIEELSITQAQTQSVRMKVVVPEETGMLSLQSNIPAWRQITLHLVAHALGGLVRGDELTVEVAGSGGQMQFRVYDTAATMKNATTAGLNKVGVLASHCGGNFSLYANPHHKSGICRELTIPLNL
jgi:signal transduction histidine kinase